MNLPISSRIDGGATPSAPFMRALGVDDIPALLELAREAIPDTMAARLGPRFADRYHRALLDEPELHLDGYFIGDQLLGFIVYTHDVREALRSAFRRHAVAFVWSLSLALLSPRRLAFVLRIAGSILGRLPEPAMDIKAELLTVAVHRDARGKDGLRRSLGINVPHALFQRALDYLRARGVPAAKVFCKLESVDPIANAFMRKEAFVLRGQVVRWGIVTNLYVNELTNSQTVGASAR